MGFYYNSGEPPKDDAPGGCSEFFAVTFAVFAVLAKPLGMMLGFALYVIVLIWAFSVAPAVGLVTLAVPAGALGAWALWEWRHPPKLT